MKENDFDDNDFTAVVVVLCMITPGRLLYEFIATLWAA